MTDQEQINQLKAQVSKMLNYPVNIIDSTQGFTIQFLDVPEAITYGETLEEALENAVDCIDTAVEFYYEEKRAIPMPSSADGRYTVSPSPLVDLKIVLHNEMLAQNVSKAEMALEREKLYRELNCND